MKVTLRYLEIFKAIVEKGSYRKAAAHLDLRQPSLSTAIKNLEQELGLVLIDRSNRDVRLTLAGRELYGHLSPIFERLALAISSTKGVALGRGGSISVGYIDFAMLGPLPQLLTKFRAVNPNIHVDINFISSRKQIEEIYKGTLDIGFIMSNDNKLPTGISAKPISREGLVAVLPPNHAFSERSFISLNDLKKEDFVITAHLRGQSQARSADKGQAGSPAPRSRGQASSYGRAEAD